ncbi:hypothetical protein [Limnobacter sp.]|uniref:hypothetical protein n=1 Tax=Limnobacter sp. TaxID=2003368 RepID=UPI0035115AFA
MVFPALRMVPALVVAAALQACTGSEPPVSAGGSRAQASGVGANGPCFSNACADITPLATIPDAENLIFSNDGRLFVSGGRNVYEVLQKPDASFEAKALASEECNFTGLAIARNTLYANCGDGRLWAGPLKTQGMAIAPIFQMEGLGLANGLVDGPDGNSLYLADGPLPGASLPSPKLVKLQLDPQNPLRVLNQSTWLDLAGRFPNGVQRAGRTLLFTDSAPPAFGQLSAVTIRPDGSPSVPLVIGQFNAIPDDFSLVAGGYAVTYFFSGQVVRLGVDGTVAESFDPFTFSTGVSQARAGRPPMFKTTDLLVTEKGLLGEQDSPLGNKLTLVRRKPAGG